ncbi:pyridoxamine 5'-phosphate oxidase family protein [Sinorhizobium numidicum]|uniref:Pyridoxamine 5'-phosphate oxidase family protein n=1 Tax=Sinorhizobium numidicum TaxID=680248 RepID=A0ABY8CWC2_9HYPH|nr:MSMEG_1061 family FMN-dependent PPOX-type flavoprotein [Sinorhizobium numidicum]WEX76260.1 pyridoxamine 5'-phosphate oxidase family protein [Sinorhizobium numidicum]WEX82920.1 pyridoxamine 5'-phosphate oxidase family protein [Sinorhizobium numidicum]
MQHDGSGLRHRFRDIVTSEEQLRTVLGPPSERSIAKVLRTIDEQARHFIAHSPFVFVASVGADGLLDVSPKGDPAGFVKVLDEKTVAIPDRPGNRRLDTLRNVLGNPNVGLIFLIPGVTHTLRMAGKALIVRDAELHEATIVNGKRPEHWSSKFLTYFPIVRNAWSARTCGNRRPGPISAACHPLRRC